MKIEHRVTALILLIGAWLAVMCCSKGCAPRAMSPENLLDSPQRHVRSGMKLLKLGKYDDALSQFELAKKLEPVFSMAYVGSGLVWGYKGDFKKGIKEIEKAKDLASTDEEKVCASVGMIRLCVMGKESVHEKWLKKAESAYKDSVDLLPESSEAHYYMGEAYKEALNFKKASELFKKVLEINNTYVREARHALNLINNRQR